MKCLYCGGRQRKAPKGEAKSEYSGNPIGGDPSSIEDEPSGTAAQTEIRTLGLRKGNQFKYLLDYGDNLIHTVEVLEVSKRGAVNETYQLIIENVGEPLLSMDTVKNSRQRA
ncbi:hypothetical protein ES703_116455 [subsurface metagenome]